MRGSNGKRRSRQRSWIFLITTNADLHFFKGRQRSDGPVRSQMHSVSHQGSIIRLVLFFLPSPSLVVTVDDIVQTRAQLDLIARLDSTIQDAAANCSSKNDPGRQKAPSLEISTLAALITDYRTKRPSQKMEDRVIRVFMEFMMAQTPLGRAFKWFADTGQRYDDAFLFGTRPEEPDRVVFDSANLGDADPDCRTPAVRIPRLVFLLVFVGSMIDNQRRPVRLTLAPCADIINKASEERFERSGLPERSRLPAPASFVVPALPTGLVKVRKKGGFRSRLLTTIFFQVSHA
jgi:hypothetical protein